MFIRFDFESKFLKFWKRSILVPFLCIECETWKGFYFNKGEMNCVSLCPLRLMTNQVNRNTSSGWHITICVFFFFLLCIVSLLKES